MKAVLLSGRQSVIIGECLRAATEGPFFKDSNAEDLWWEFQTLIGLTPQKVARIAQSWPNVDISNPEVATGVHNVLLNLLGYPHGCEKHWPQFIAASREEVEDVFAQWQTLTSITRIEKD